MVVIDGHDIQAFNLAWLRSQISLVGQEPVLFSTTIFENIRNGLVNCDGELSPAYVKERVISAAKKANAHDFIQGLPLAYETQVGQKGLQLSGGQRQRISIARALIKDPKLLLLDEATSALDTRSEAAVQRALESAAVGRTTIVVAHRLSTIQKADNIIVMSEGRIVEQGKHEALMSLEGVYAGFVQKQQLNARNHDDDAEFEEDPVHQILPSKGESQRITSEKLTVSEKQNPDNFDANSHFHVAASSKVSLWDTLGFITSLNKPEWKYLLFGLITAILAGAVVPVYVHTNFMVVVTKR
jgi:ATP-binding cassette subfamily B (MDR/TAP) protein 1